MEIQLLDMFVNIVFFLVISRVQPDLLRGGWCSAFCGRACTAPDSSYFKIKISYILCGQSCLISEVTLAQNMRRAGGTYYWLHMVSSTL